MLTDLLRVVGRGDHDADRFAVVLLAAQDGEQPYAKEHAVELVGTVADKFTM